MSGGHRSAAMPRPAFQLPDNVANPPQQQPRLLQRTIKREGGGRLLQMGEDRKPLLAASSIGSSSAASSSAASSAATGSSASTASTAFTPSDAGAPSIVEHPRIPKLERQEMLLQVQPQSANLGGFYIVFGYATARLNPETGLIEPELAAPLPPGAHLSYVPPTFSMLHAMGGAGPQIAASLLSSAAVASGVPPAFGTATQMIASMDHAGHSWPRSTARVIKTERVKVTEETEEVQEKRGVMKEEKKPRINPVYDSSIESVHTEERKGAIRKLPSSSAPSVPPAFSRFTRASFSSVTPMDDASSSAAASVALQRTPVKQRSGRQQKMLVEAASRLPPALRSVKEEHLRVKSRGKREEVMAPPKAPSSTGGPCTSSIQATEGGKQKGAAKTSSTEGDGPSTSKMMKKNQASKAAAKAKNEKKMMEETENEREKEKEKKEKEKTASPEKKKERKKRQKKVVVHIPPHLRRPVRASTRLATIEREAKVASKAVLDTPAKKKILDNLQQEILKFYVKNVVNSSTPNKEKRDAACIDALKKAGIIKNSPKKAEIKKKTPAKRSPPKRN